MCQILRSIYFKCKKKFMDASKIDMFILTNGNKLPENKVLLLREKLESVDDSKWAVLSSIQFKDPTIALILSLFLGVLGIDRFYIGSTGLGIVKLLTLGIFYIGAFVDLFLIYGATKEQNFKKIQSLIF